MPEHESVAPANNAPQDLTPLWHEIYAALATRSVFPAIPVTESSAIWPGTSLRGWRSFIALADAIEARLLYVEVLAAPPLPNDHDRAVRAVAVDGHAGQTGRIELAFAHNGVLHIWHAETPWISVLEADLRDNGGLGETDRPTRPEYSEWVDWRDTAGRQRLEAVFGAEMLAATVERCTKKAVGAANSGRYALESALIDNETGDPQFRDWAHASPDDPQYGLKRSAERYVLEQVIEAAVALRRERVTAALSELETLFAALRDFPGWHEARLAAEKRRRIREFVTSRLGFYDPDVGDRLYTAARDAT